MKSLIVGFILVFALGLVALMTMDQKQPDNKKEQQSLSTQQQPPVPNATMAVEIKEGKTYSAVIHTQAGDMTIALNAAQTPITVNNFVTLSRKGFYDNTIFHRVIAGFMIQGGDPKGDGTGGPGYTFADEPFEGEYTRGTVAMANSGPDTNGSQFFIMHQDGPQLPKNYVIFGKVTEGLETLDAIATAQTKANAQGEQSVPVTPVKVTSIDIIEQ